MNVNLASVRAVFRCLAVLLSTAACSAGAVLVQRSCPQGEGEGVAGVVLGRQSCPQGEGLEGGNSLDQLCQTFRSVLVVSPSQSDFPAELT